MSDTERSRRERRALAIWDAIIACEAVETTPEAAETASARLARRAVAIRDYKDACDLHGLAWSSIALAEIIEESDRAAGCDPDALRAEVLEQARLLGMSAERELALRAEVLEQARLLGMSAERELALRAEIDRIHEYLDLPSEGDVVQAIQMIEAEVERLKTEVVGKDEAIERWASMSHDQSVALTASVAREAALRAEIERLNELLTCYIPGPQTDAINKQIGYATANLREERDNLTARLAVLAGVLTECRKCTAEHYGAARLLKLTHTALTDLPARAAAMLRVVEAAREWADKRDGKGGGGPYFGECDRLAAAVRALDGEAG